MLPQMRDVFSMNPKQLSRICEIIYGGRWQTALAKDCAVSSRTVRWWVSGDRKIPDDMKEKLIVVLKEKLVKIQSVLMAMDFIPSPNLEIPKIFGFQDGSVESLLKDIQKTHKKFQGEKHRLILVDEETIIECQIKDKLIHNGKEIDFEDMISGLPSLYAIRDNGDIILWPNPGKMVELYVD